MACYRRILLLWSSRGVRVSVDIVSSAFADKNYIWVAEPLIPLRCSSLLASSAKFPHPTPHGCAKYWVVCVSNTYRWWFVTISLILVIKMSSKSMPNVCASLWCVNNLCWLQLVLTSRMRYYCCWLYSVLRNNSACGDSEVSGWMRWSQQGHRYFFANAPQSQFQNNVHVLDLGSRGRQIRFML